MKVLGILFVLSSAATVGFQLAAFLKKECLVFRQLQDSLQLMRNEISTCGTQLPQLFALMAAAVNGTLEEVFSRTAKEMEQNPWITPADALIGAMNGKQMPIVEEILISLGKKLGKYDVDAQLQGIDLAIRQTENALLNCEKERRVKSGTYRTLGICTGLAVAILLI